MKWWRSDNSLTQLFTILFSHFQFAVNLLCLSCWPFLMHLKTTIFRVHFMWLFFSLQVEYKGSCFFCCFFFICSACLSKAITTLNRMLDVTLTQKVCICCKISLFKEVIIFCFVCGHLQKKQVEQADPETFLKTPFWKQRRLVWEFGGIST